MLAGLIIATGPLGARLRIGIIDLAQPELNVPISPITSLSRAIAFALVEHFAESHLPACAVASSHDW